MAAINENDNNSVFNLDSANNAVSPDQTSMFASDENVTRMDISHDQGQTVESSETHDEEVSTGTKAKILAALAIVGIAGYVAYWVQEPIQLRTAVLDGETATEETAPATTTEESTTVADASEAPKGPSVSVDVSLFGFEPATLKIDKGTTVIWTNTSTEDQTIIGSSPEGESFVSPVLTSGQSFSYKFDLDSSFEYYSTYNPALKATITVGLGSPSTTVTPTSETAGETTDAATASPTDELMGAAPEVTSEMVDNALTDALAAANAATSTPTETGANAAMTTADEEVTAAAMEDLKPAAVTPSKLSKTGPTETLYAFALVTIAWFNRKKLAKVFQK